jgi:hypothetical protein
MAMLTDDHKLAAMEWCSIWEPALPLAPHTPFSDPDKQQLLWGYPGVLWDGARPEGGTRRLFLVLGVGH